MANVKATDLIDFTRASKGHALAKVSYGDELVVNGGFDTDSDWEKEASWTISGGTATYDGAIHVERIYQNLSITTGKLVKISYSVKNIEAGKTAYFNVSGSTTGSPLYKAYTNHTEGDYEIITTVEEGTVGLVFVALNSGTGGSFDLDNVSVKEVLFNQPDGTLQLFEHPNNIPRIEYDADGNLLGLLIEEARTNLFGRSEDFSHSAWFHYNTAPILNAIGPNGVTNSAATFSDNNSGGSDGVYIAETVAGLTTSTDYTFSVFAKAKDTGWIVLRVHAFGVTGPEAYFDLTNGVIGTSGAGVTPKIKDYGGGWYRCSITFQTGSDVSGSARISLAEADGDTTLNLDGTHSVLIYGAQFEQGSFSTSYIKTQGSTVSRASDVASIDVDQFGYNQSEGTLFAEAQMFIKDVSYKAIANLNTNGSNRIRMISSSSVNVIQAEITNGGTTQLAISEAIPEGSLFSGAIAYKQNDSCASVNGSVETTDTSCTIPAVTKLDIMTSNSGHIKSLTYTPKRLSNAKLQELTK